MEHPHRFGAGNPFPKCFVAFVGSIKKISAGRGSYRKNGRGDYSAMGILLAEMSVRFRDRIANGTDGVTARSRASDV